MAETPTTTNNVPPPPAPGDAPPVVPAAPNALLSTPPAGDPPPPSASVMPESFEGGADAWAKLDDAGKTAAITTATEKATAESRARVDAYAQAVGKEARLAAYNALTKDEKVEAYKALSEDARKELGVADPARPTYTEFKAPEGVTLDAEGMKAASELFADMGLSQDNAQKLVDLALGREKAAAEAVTKAYVDMNTKWVAEVKADPEIGGDKLDASIATAAVAIDRVGGAEKDSPLRQALALTGAGNHPAVVKAFVRMGQMMKEDRFQAGNGAAPPAPKSPAEVIYDGNPKA